MRNYLANVLNSKQVKLYLAGYVLLIILPFIGGVNLFDWDEVNFAEAAREMLATGKYSMVQINFESFWEKPPLFIWLQALSLKLFGVTPFAARFVNALVGLVTLLTVYNIGEKLHSQRLAVWWTALYLVSITPHFYLQTGLIDPLFNLFIFGAVYQLFLGEREQNYRRFALSGLLLGMAVLTKGPVAGLIVTLVLITFIIRNWKSSSVNFKHVLVAAIPAILVASIWMALVVSTSGFGLLISFFNYQLELLTQSVATHGQPWYYHFVVLLIGCFPASVLAVNRFTINHESGFEEWMKILFWVVLILFSIVTTKIVHYSSLCFFPLTYLAAMYLTERNHEKTTGARMKVLWYSVLGVVSIGLIAVPVLGLAISKAPTLITKYVENEFIQDVARIPGGWSAIDIVLGVVVGMLFIQAVQLLNRSRVNWSLFILPILLSLYLYRVTKHVDQQLQKPIVGFYQEISDEDCYVETYKFKSYAQYFYPQIKPYQESDRLLLKRKQILEMIGAQSSTDLSAYERIVYTVKQREWFIKGAVDKPVYLVCLNSYAHELQEQETMALHGTYGPYSVFKRTP